MICSKDSFTESFSAVQLPELINSQTIHLSVHDSALRFTFTYWGTVRSRTIVHNHSWETQRCSEWYTCTKIITRWKCPLCTVKSLNMMVHGCWQHSANFSTVREWESCPQRQFSVCSRFANHERITAQTWITSSQFSVLCEWVPTCTLAASFAEGSRLSHGSSTPGRHAHVWAQLNWERN